MERWRQHFAVQLDSDHQVHRVTNVKLQATESGGRSEITAEEMKYAISKMKLGKAAGGDEITPEMVKYMGPHGEQLLLAVLQLAWRYKSIPRDWELAIIIPIFKKGDNRECSNHRGISLLSVPGKLYSRVFRKAPEGSGGTQT